ncbi:MAG: class I SAM-dependent methyltransferase [Candidatus Odinarchaeota archaeon]
MKLEAVRKRYDRYSRFYDRFEGRMEQIVFQNLREQVIGSLKGNVLEIGVGTGKNLPHYHPGTEVTGIDISRGMLVKARNRLPLFRGESIELRLMDAGELAFNDGMFDTVVCTFVLCSVPAPVRAVTEMLRVLKPGGWIILLEHVLSKMPLVALGQRLLNPLTRGLLGYNIDRDTVNILRRASAVIMKDQDLTKTDLLKLIICRRQPATA